MQRHFSYSDRIRYYWPDPSARNAVADLRTRLHARRIPAPLLHQYLTRMPATVGFDAILIAAVQQVLSTYHQAIHG